ncbi:putative hydrocarbon binding protein [Psychrobacillus insolitus]|uniref:Putative hydrocarbon binding protein n=1 Tax=Psychrobacillus insolitus TaxID=1461 RepID=A0A2W7N913_9BACI|nr:YslB family protein [Psychrobacillus insolitus]PZX07019.1 putative hydrocarbon binding protein [Psychrobacillus insolitus]
MNEEEQSHVTSFGYELIRDHVLASILGKHEKDILYWAGKDLARKFPLYIMEEAITFFQQAGWGTLTLDKTTKDSAYYSLQTYNLPQSGVSRTHRLEAGFLAEQQQKISGFLTECYDEQVKKNGIVTFQLKWDVKTII